MLSYESISSYRDMADPEGFEPSTCDLEGRRSIQPKPLIHNFNKLTFLQVFAFFTPRNTEKKKHVASIKILLINSYEHRRAAIQFCPQPRGDKCTRIR